MITSQIKIKTLPDAFVRRGEAAWP